eukprot:tig00001545_g9335.t1
MPLDSMAPHSRDIDTPAPQCAVCKEAIPIVSFSDLQSADARQRVGTQLVAALRDVGFAYISGVRDFLEPACVERVFDASRRFFELPLEEKALYRSGAMRGFEAVGAESLAVYRKPDVKESYTLGGEQTYGVPRWDERFGARNVWPGEGAVPGFREAVEEARAGLGRLAAEVLRACARGVGLPEDVFAAAHRRQDHSFRLLHYPAVREDELLPGQRRCGEHTDYGSITLLLQDEAGGLQVRTRAGWRHVRPIPGTVVLNCGDLLAAWTNELFSSTLHRVGAPPAAPGEGPRERYSVALFCSPDLDATVEPLLAGPGGRPLHTATTTGDYLLTRLTYTAASSAR